MTDFANIFSTSGKNIVSSGFQIEIKRLAQSISKSENFSQLTVEDALEWLKTTDEECGQLFKRFLEIHGHRGHKEYDFMSITLKDNPLILLKTIQTMLPMIRNEENISTEDIFEEIETQLSTKNRLLLEKWLIPACHEMNAIREEGKSHAIKIVDKLRQFFLEIGRIMSFKEGRIPKPDLIYYMTLHELKKLTQFRDPKIVVKAKQRKKIYSKVDKLFFDELVIGYEMRPKNVCLFVETYY